MPIAVGGQAADLVSVPGVLLLPGGVTAAVEAVRAEVSRARVRGSTGSPEPGR
jgi:hypothetical protein